LGGVDAARKSQERCRDVGADDLVVSASKIFHQHSLPRQVSRVSAAQSITPCNVYGQQVGPLGASGDARRPTDEGIALGSTSERHNHPLTRFPVRADAAICAVFVELFVNFAGYPEQRQLA
jgi:hypothetical protein